jgi:hypothetical protein
VTTTMLAMTTIGLHAIAMPLGVLRSGTAYTGAMFLAAQVSAIALSVSVLA